MIYIVTRHNYAHTVEDLSRQTAENAAADVRLLCYEDLFAEREVPVGHYVFTDFDRLTAYEIQVAETIARRLEEAAPGVRIVNRPTHVLERYPLLRQLHRLGLSDFSAVRLDSGDMPSKYPVFVRLEDDCKYPDTPLLHSPEELVAAIDGLRQSGMPLKRRVAIEFCAEPNDDGLYRKYGVFRIGDHLIPQHLMHNSDWYVKRSTNQSGPSGPDEAGKSDPLEEEKTRYLNDFPHASDVMERFEIAGIGFGRIDYGFVGGRLQTYEINTNPTFPPLWPKQADDPRAERRALFRGRILAALAALDTPFEGPETIRFKLPEPRLQTFQRRPNRKAKKSAPSSATAEAAIPATEDAAQPT